MPRRGERSPEFHSFRPKLDLHDRFRDSDEYVLNEIDRFLHNNRAAEVEVVYGTGTGKNKDRVLRLLEQHPLVEKVEKVGRSIAMVIVTE